MTDTRFGKPSFKCPFCDVHAQQTWYLAGAVKSSKSLKTDVERQFELYSALIKNRNDAPPPFAKERFEQIAIQHTPGILYQGLHLENLTISECVACQRAALWRADDLFYPAFKPRAPHPDLPADCVSDFKEAVAVAPTSPRAGAALLRAAMERLLTRLSGKTNPSDAIDKLVAAGLDDRVRQALEVVRVTGNKALHRYEIAADGDNAADFDTLAGLFDFIVDELITRPAGITAAFQRLPAKELAKIERRGGDGRDAASPADGEA